MLACRRISRLPSTKVSGPLTEAPPVRTGIHEGGRALTYVISGRLRQATAGVRTPLAGRRYVTYSSVMPANPPATARAVSRGAIEGPHERERIGTLVVPDHDDLAALLADRIVETVRREVAAKGRCVLGLATGSTPLGIYRELIRRHGAADFFGEDNVPREAITMGVATILQAREIALIATGEHKADVVRRAVEGEPSPDVAATFLQGHPNAAAYLDLAAAAELTRIKTPWLLEPVEWTPAMTERAVVWLAEQVGKAVLKLTARDYSENHLSPLLAKYGAPGPVNGIVFNRLRDKIRGRRKLPSRQRILVFAPHPDDDGIAMGGILRTLWENENAIVVAYMTSGNIAVIDHDCHGPLDFE